MTHRKMLCAFLCAAGTCGLLAAPVTASASDATLRHTIKVFSPRILETEGRVETAVGEYKTTRKTAPVERALASAVQVLRELRKTIAGERAGSGSVREGKHKLEQGLMSVIIAYQHLEKAFRVKAANATAAKEQAQKADSAVKRGQQQLAEGIDLLNEPVKRHHVKA